MPGAGPTLRRRELGAFLRALRLEKGWTVDQVAEHLLCSPSKVSRIETGQRGTSPRDIRDLCYLYEIADERERERIAALASEARQPTWWQDRGLPSSPYYGLEADAASIKDFGFGVVPGLLQSADYARAVFRALPLRLTAEATELRVQQRLARQQLLDSDNAPRFHAVIDEAVLHRVVGSASIMQLQLEKLLETSRRPNVTLQVLPYEAGAMPVGPNKFIILGFGTTTVPDIIFIENLNGDLYLDRKEDVELYSTAFAELAEMAVPPARTRDMIAERIEIYRSRGA